MTSFFHIVTAPDETENTPSDWTSRQTNNSASRWKHAGAATTSSMDAGETVRVEEVPTPLKRINVAVIGDTESGRTTFIKSLKKKKLWSVYSVVDALTNYNDSSQNLAVNNSFSQFEELSHSSTSPGTVRGAHSPSNVFMRKNVQTAPLTARITYATGAPDTAKNATTTASGAKKETIEVLISEAGSIPLIAEVGNGACRTLPDADFVFLLFPLSQVKQVSKGRDCIYVSQSDKRLLCELFATAYSQMQHRSHDSTRFTRKRTFFYVVGTFKNSLIHRSITAVQEVLHTLRAFSLQQTQFSAINKQDASADGDAEAREIIISDFFGADLSDGSCISLDAQRVATVAEMFSDLIKQYAPSVADMNITPIQLLEMESEITDAKKVAALVSDARRQGDYFLLEQHELYRYFFTCDIVGKQHIYEALADAQHKGILALMHKQDASAPVSTPHGLSQVPISFSSVCLFPSLLANIIASPFLYYDAYYHRKESRELLLVGVSLKKCRAADASLLSAQGVLPYPVLQQLSAGVFSAHVLVEEDETPDETRRRSANLVQLYMRTLEEAEVAFVLKWDFGIYKKASANNDSEDGPRPVLFTLDEPIMEVTGTGSSTSLPSVNDVVGNDSVISDVQTPIRKATSPSSRSLESSTAKRQQLFSSLIGIFSPSGLDGNSSPSAASREKPLFYSANKTGKTTEYDPTSDVLQGEEATTFLVVPALREQRMCPKDIADLISSCCVLKQMKPLTGNNIYSCVLHLQHCPTSFFYTLICRLSSVVVISGLYGDAVFVKAKELDAAPFSLDIRAALLWSIAPSASPQVEYMYEKEIQLVVYDVSEDTLQNDITNDLQLQKILFLQLIKDTMLLLQRAKFPGTQIAVKRKLLVPAANMKDKLSSIDKAVEWSI